MNWTITWEPSAVAQVSRWLEEDPAGLAEILEVSDSLANDPRPAGSSPWGSNHRRLRHGRWRVLYRTDEDGKSIHIEHVGRLR